MKQYEYDIRQIDAWNSEEGWAWNTSYHMGILKTYAQNERKAFTHYLKQKHGITFKRNRTIIEYDGSIWEIQDRKTHEPLFAMIPNY